MYKLNNTLHNTAIITSQTVIQVILISIFFTLTIQFISKINKVKKYCSTM